jgi:FAD/FMN-containing dehydrogenase
MILPSTQHWGELRDNIAGAVIAPGDLDYDAWRRVLLPSVDRHPAVIVRPVDAREVAHVVSLAMEEGFELAVRGGGHSYAGHGTSEGGIVLDLAALRTLEIHAESRVVHAAGGLTAGDVVNAGAPHGLTVGFGDTATVGIGGITLGGGVGFLVRKHGLTIDHLFGAQIVTADGRIHEVGAADHPDLFWAIRGGGGNFGVVTRFDFQLHPVDMVTGGMLALPATPSTLAELAAAVEAAPDELSMIANVLLAPPLPFVPPKLVGRPLVLAHLAHVGEPEDGVRAIAPLRSIAHPVADFVCVQPYSAMFSPEPQPPAPHAVLRTFFTDTFDENAADELLGRLNSSTAQLAAAEIRVLGGAVARVAAEATAFAHRQRRLMINVAAVYASPAEDLIHRRWADAAATALRQGADAAYVNFLGDEAPERVRAAYPGATWDRLSAVKLRYDPQNLFRVNQNIPPATR